MPWFVIRQSVREASQVYPAREAHPSIHTPKDAVRIYPHREAYNSREAAEAVAWDNSRIWDGPVPGKPIDETVPPFVVEAADLKEAIIRWHRAGAPYGRSPSA